MSSKNNNISCKPAIDIDRRNSSEIEVRFPLVDSNNITVEQDRRLAISIYLSRIEVKESQLAEDEFEILFKQ